jgi:hypothetical protein
VSGGNDKLIGFLRREVGKIGIIEKESTKIDSMGKR